MQRRSALAYLLASPVLTATPKLRLASAIGKRLKISLNAYSFNAPLMAHTVSVEQMMDFSVNNGFERSRPHSVIIYPDSHNCHRMNICFH